MNRITALSIGTIVWLFVLSITLSGMLSLSLRVARAKNRAESRASWLFEDDEINDAANYAKIRFALEDDDSTALEKPLHIAK
jgi:cbb3-type cytochrome oxidase subunit 3